MSITRFFTFISLCCVMMATMFCMIGWYAPAIALLATVVVAGVAIAVTNWHLN